MSSWSFRRYTSRSENHAIACSMFVCRPEYAGRIGSTKKISHIFRGRSPSSKCPHIGQDRDQPHQGPSSPYEGRVSFPHPILGIAPKSIVPAVHLDLPFRFLKVSWGSGSNSGSPKPSQLPASGRNSRRPATVCSSCCNLLPMAATDCTKIASRSISDSIRSASVGASRLKLRVLTTRRGRPMNPACTKCESSSTRRRSRTGSLKDRFMFLIGMYPWECVDCHTRFFSTKRYNRSGRHALGEVYTGSKHTPSVKPGSEESRGQ